MNPIHTSRGRRDHSEVSAQVLHTMLPMTMELSNLVLAASTTWHARFFWDSTKVALCMTSVPNRRCLCRTSMGNIDSFKEWLQRCLPSRLDHRLLSLCTAWTSSCLCLLFSSLAFALAAVSFCTLSLSEEAYSLHSNKQNLHRKP